MKKNITIAVLALMLVTLVLYSFIKASDAEKALKEAEKQHKLVMEYRQRTEAQTQLAIQKATEAMKAQKEAERAMEELMKCRGN